MTYIEQLFQIFNGAVWDGDLISKSHREKLVRDGLVQQVLGWNIITGAGALWVIQSGWIKNGMAIIPKNVQPEQCAQIVQTVLAVEGNA